MMFFLTVTAPTPIYTLSLHDALPIFRRRGGVPQKLVGVPGDFRGFVHDDDPKLHEERHLPRRGEDRKSTRLNSSHGSISYAVFCLKKKKKNGTAVAHPGTEIRPTGSQ